MEELRLSFLVLGACAIVGILLHGLWSVRKNAAKKEKQSYEPKDWALSEQEQKEFSQQDEDSEVTIDVDDPLLNMSASKESQFDELGLGEVRVISSNESHDGVDDQAVNVDITEQRFDNEVEITDAESEPATEVDTPKIYSSVVTQPKPEFAEEQKQALKSKITISSDNSSLDVPEPPPFLLKEEDGEKIEPTIGSSETPSEQASQPKNEPQVEAKVSLAEQAKNLVKRKKTEPLVKKRRTPKVDEDQMRIDFDEPHKVQGAESQKEAANTPEQEVLVLNVKAPDDAPIQGAALLPMLLTLGFKFGDQDIFHRHVNSNGKGPVLFSLANMFKPGVFDIDNLENFTTQGVSLFMILPIEGDPHQVFNMMHNAARKISDEFSAQVLDGRRSVLTKQSLQQYVEKIREFERMRMIAR